MAPSLVIEKKTLMTFTLLTLLDKTCSDKRKIFYMTVPCYICSEPTMALEIRN